MRLFSAFLASFLSFPAFADVQITTEYVLRLPNAVVDRLAPVAIPLKGEKIFPLKDGAFEAAGASIVLRGMEAGIRYELSRPQPFGDHAWRVRTEKLGAYLRVTSLEIRRRDVKERNGLVIDHDQTIECRGLTLRLKEEVGAGVEGTVRAALVGGEGKLTLEEYRGHWPAGAWAVETLDCPGVGGIGSAVAGQLLELLARTSWLDTQVQPALERVLLSAGEQAKRNLADALLIPTGLAGVRLRAESGIARELSGGMEIRGKLRFSFDKARGDLRRELPLGPVAAAPMGTSAQLLLPKEAFDALLEAAFSAGLVKHEMQSKDIEGFRALARSRFMQFFAWPDLQRFPKDTNFLFRLSPLEAPKLGGGFSVRPGVVGAHLSVPLSILMLAPIERRWLPYVNFRTRMEGPTIFRVSGGTLRIQVHASAQELVHAFAPNYTDRFCPNARIATNRIRDSLLEAINENEISLPLPALSLAGGLEFRPSALGLLSSGRGQALQLQFAAKPGAR